MRWAVFLALITSACCMSSCDSRTSSTSTAPSSEGPGNSSPTAVVDKPVPPLSIAEPPALPDRLDGKDLKGMEVSELLGRANLAMSKEDYPRAAAYQYWYVQKSKTGQYNLACFLARTGKTDAAFFWLQRAGLEEGVDTHHATVDEDLVSLHNDKRWREVIRFLTACNRYFETASIGRTTVVLPKGYGKGTPIPAVVWLHGLGSNPENFVNDDAQEYADSLNIALIGVSGTRPRGPRSFAWADDPEADARRVREALAELSSRVTIKKGQVILLGFSQGAQMGLEIAVRYPEDYAGAIVLSPGAQYHLEDVTPSPLLAKRGFVVSCGAQEHPGNVQLTQMDADWLKKAKAKVIHKPYPGVSAHSFPRDFDERFPEWIAFILKARGE